MNFAPYNLVFVILTSVRSEKLKSAYENIPFLIFAPLILIFLRSSPEKLYPRSMIIVILFAANVICYNDLSVLVLKIEEI